MSSSSLTCTNLPPQFHSKKSAKSSSRPPTLQLKVRPITASIFDKLPKPLSPSTATLVPPPTTEPTTLPIRKIPGDYGLPIVGAIKDRNDYFYDQGEVEFFKSRQEKYNSTVYRVNMPPGPFISSHPEVIALLDGKSFPVLFDLSKVEKKDLFTGTYMPSTDLTGGFRVLSYLDPSEPNHEKLKNLLFYMLKSRRDYVLPEFHKTYTALFETLEKEIGLNGKAAFNDLNESAAFTFLARAYFGKDPADTKLGSDGPKYSNLWLLFQLGPIFTLGLPQTVEEGALHTAPLPPLLIKGGYDKLYDFFYESAGSVLDEAEKMGIARDEACHNILFATCFNSFGGFKVLFPTLLKWVGLAGPEFQTKLAQEIRSAIKANGGNISMAAMEQMPLMKSVVYETLRIEPPVPYQYGHAKTDLVIESHDAAFKVKKGEMLFGYQPFATKDPKIFDKAEEFVPDRFMGEGEKMLKHVMWSNGPETEDPTVADKQCAGKNFVVLVTRLLAVEFFLRYDTYEFEVGKALVGSSVTLTSLTKADS